MGEENRFACSQPTIPLVDPGAGKSGLNHGNYIAIGLQDGSQLRQVGDYLSLAGIAEWRRAVLGIGEPNHSLQTGTSQGVEISLHVVQIRLSDGAADKSFQIKQPQNKRDILGLTVAEKSAPIKKRVERGVSFGVAVEPALGIGKQVISGRVADDRALTVIVV